MPFWNVPGVTAEPELVVAPWVVIELGDGSQVVVGYSPARWEGRVSSGIIEKDIHARRVKTVSGRVYRLEGPPALDADAAYVFNGLSRARGYHAVRDVSGEFWPGYNGCALVDTAAVRIQTALAKQDAGDE